MPSIRDLVAAIRQREGVDAAVVLGRDGLLIDGQLLPGLDADVIAARIPALISAADEFGGATSRGELVPALLEHKQGIAVISALTPDAVLLGLVAAREHLAHLLRRPRHHAEHIAALV